MKAKFLYIISIITASYSCELNSQNLILNGNFEFCNPLPLKGSYSENPSIDHWRRIGYIDVHSNDLASLLDGKLMGGFIKQHIDVNGTLGSVEQTVNNLIIGKEYTFSFFSSISVHIVNNSWIQKAGVTVTDTVSNQVIISDNWTFGFKERTKWKQFTYTFKATSSSVKVKFFSTLGSSTSQHGILIDSVSLFKSKGSLTYQNFSLCNGENIMVGNKKYHIQGTYIDTLLNYENEDSIIHTNLKIKPLSFTSLFYNVCEGETITNNNHTYHLAGVYLDTLNNYLGCDSIITTTLNIIPKSTSYQTISFCKGNMVRIGVHNYYTTGTYVDTFINHLGCDSILTTQLNVLEKSTSRETIEICPNETVYWRSKLFTQTGLYSDTTTNYLGCDSIILLKIKLFNSPINCADPLIFIPNSFSPNNDEQNNFFKPIFSNVKELNMEIYNRWGEKIFENSSLNEGWNGEYKNTPCEQGIYLYLINITGTNGKKGYYKGTLTLLR